MGKVFKIKLTKEMIDAIFDDEQNDHQNKIVMNLYELAILGFSDPESPIEMVLGWPAVSRETNEYLFKKFAAFDREHHPRVMNGGLWMNKGFSTKEGADPWVIDLSGCRLKMSDGKLMRLRN